MNDFDKLTRERQREAQDNFIARLEEAERRFDRAILDPMQAGDFQDWDNTPPQARSSHAAPKSVADKLSRQEKVARISSLFWLIVWSAVIVGSCIVAVCWILKH